MCLRLHQLLSGSFIFMTGLSLSEQMINWSNFLKLNELWDFPAVGKSANQWHSCMTSVLLFSLSVMSSGHRACCWRRPPVTQSQEVICLVCCSRVLAVRNNTFLDGSAALCKPLRLSSNQKQLGLVMRIPLWSPPPLPLPSQTCWSNQVLMENDEKAKKAYGSGAKEEARGQNHLLSKFNTLMDKLWVPKTHHTTE